MGTGANDQTNPALPELLNQLVDKLKKKQLTISEILPIFSQDKNNKSTNNPEIHTLLKQMIDNTHHNSNIATSKVQNLFQQFIEEKVKSGISSAEITSLLTQITKKAEKNTLTAAELSALWLQYLGDSMAICVYKYFLNIVEDEEIKSILELSLQLSEGHIAKITEFLESENYQIPLGFTEKDVNLNAPRLFTDSFLLFYSYIMAIHGLTAYSLAITNSERQDIQNYFYECLVTSKDLFQKIVNLAKNQPFYSSVPTIPSSHEVEFVDSTGIISNLFGDKRPLNSSEISNLFFNSKKTGFVRSLSLAFSQVAELEEVRKFMVKNVELSGKDAESFNTILQQDHLPIPESWDAEITDSKVSPFSDKLMVFHAAFLVNAALSYYGASIGASLRSDIILNYEKVLNHAMHAGSTCYKIMVKYGWLEKQPEAIDRKSLAQDSEK
ncbi:DUF3231 family protein [Heyndrickxia ginsengihumi]|uniref:DUF3231 family protein n=1 Tax=Heyndrickxia ginsengihumi TaxID=363870 RepID=UPI0004B1D340|nr:DUF3231 family protein [Heyndrickxia ginsengihumi]